MSESKVTIASGLIVLCFTSAAVWFASQQSIWVDETTQLLGLSLPFGEQLRWLIGQSDIDLGVPPDRMPPLSYWLGSIWSSLFGLSEMSMRLLGIAATMAGAPALFLAGRKLGSDAGGLFVLGSLFTAPGLIIIAGEIRTYPVFFGLSCWALLAYVCALMADNAQSRIRSVAILSILTILMGYTHFFGVVAACCLFGGLFLHRVLLGLEWKDVVVCFCIVFACLAGLTPFVTAAVGISPDTPAADINVTDIFKKTLRFTIRLVSDPVFLANRPAHLLLLTGITLLAIGTLVGLRQDRRDRAIILAMLFPVGTAICGLGVLSEIASGFDATTPTYSIWLLPFLFACLAFAFAKKPLPSVALIAALSVITGNLMASSTLLRHATLYTHGPGEWLADQLDETSQTLLIHKIDDAWGHSYFPVFYLKPGSVTQIVQTQDNEYLELTTKGTVPIENLAEFTNGFDQAFSIRTLPLSGTERADVARGDLSCDEILFKKFSTHTPQVYCGVLAASLEPIID